MSASDAATTTHGRPIRATDAHTRREVAALFSSRGSARVLTTAAVGLAVVRLSIGGPVGPGDLLVVLATVAITGTVEWMIHRFLLHAPHGSWTARTLGTGTGHRHHHLDPPDVDWLLLRTVDAAVFVTAFGVVTAAWAIPLLALVGAALLGPFLTAWTCAAIGLLHYEWVHLLVHSRYRCRSSYYARLARNHRRHHYRNEQYWFGVTTNTGDRLLRTYPADTSGVPLSPTARSLAG